MLASARPPGPRSNGYAGSSPVGLHQIRDRLSQRGRGHRVELQEHLEERHGAQDEIVAGAEYFVDLDPGLGNATPLSPLDGGFDSSSEEIQFQVETADLTAGSHVVYVRLKDQNGQWGRPRSSAIKVVVANADIPPTVVAAEYFT